MIARPAPGARPATAAWRPQTVLDRLLEHCGSGWTVIFHLGPDQRTVHRMFLRLGAKTWKISGTKLPVFRPPAANAQRESMTIPEGGTIWRQAATRISADLVVPAQASFTAVRQALDVLVALNPSNQKELP